MEEGSAYQESLVVVAVAVVAPNRHGANDQEEEGGGQNTESTRKMEKTPSTEQSGDFVLTMKGESAAKATLRQAATSDKDKTISLN